MATNVVIAPKSVQVSKLKYSEPKLLGKQGARSVYVKYEGDRLTIQMPWMSIPYGVNDGSKFAKDDNKDEAQKYTLDVSFKGHDTNPKIAVALDKMKEIEKKVVDDAFANRLTWLQDDCDGLKPLVAKLFSPIVKYDKDKETGKVVGKYPPTMKIKVPYKDDTFTFDCEDKTGDTVDFKTIMSGLKGGRVLPIIQLAGVWIAGGKYGCSWNMVGARFETATMTKVQFLPDSDDEGEVEQSDNDLDDEALSHAPAAKPVDNTVIEDSDEEDAQDEEEDGDSEVEEPPRAPTPPPAKKKTVAKPAKK